MKLNISLVLETDKEKNALVVVSGLNKLISAGSPILEKYKDGGTKVLLEKSITETNWSDALLTCLTLAQSFGRSWTVSGHVEEELILIGNEFSVVGIKWAQISLIS
ncbi:hypothetical protein [Cochlodiniinecator piscidefendens]|uniref:hypothetical protein n=1 Tax=Cochlodiniinecator piscidefendens TaxID=2715756 RepID=UPI0014073873|nr:hypothetical protein [Cochlodiniinecator piscidefendens]